MRPTLVPFFALIFPALLFVGCPNFGASTGLAAGDDAALAADTVIGTMSDSLAGASYANPSDSIPNASSSADSIPAVSGPAVAADTASVVSKADGAIPPVAVDPVPDSSAHAAVIPSPDPVKPVVEAVTEVEAPLLKPVVALSAANPAQDPKVFLNSDFEAESLECWNGNRTATSSNGAGCGQFKSIGFTPFALAQNGIAHSGSKAIDITYSKNEEMGGTNVGISADSVNVRAWYYFEPGFDFGQGMKIGRVSSFNNAKQVNDVDIILEVRSAGGKNQCGVTEMADVGLFFNGAPKGYDWGNAAANISFERGRWYAVEYQVVLNNPGRSDGAVRLWVDGQQVAARDGLNIRGTAGLDSKLNTVKIGGWYSNGANGNSCAHPHQPSKLHMDDVAIATSYIGLGAPNTVAAR